VPRLTSQLSATAWLAIGATIALAAAITFLELAEEVAAKETHQLDVAVLQWMDAHRSPALNVFFGAVTMLGSWPAITGLTLVLCIAAALRKLRRAAATLAAAVIGIPPLVVLLKPLYARPRPDVVAHLDFVDSASFPSGHALAAAIFFGTLALIASRIVLDDLHRAAIVGSASIMIVLVALSRVYLGVHYPSDVLGGVLVGTTWSLFVLLAAHLVAARQRDRPER
jgi:undecaprenyl-diphosphatase